MLKCTRECLSAYRRLLKVLQLGPYSQYAPGKAENGSDGRRSEINNATVATHRSERRRQRGHGFTNESGHAKIKHALSAICQLRADISRLGVLSICMRDRRWEDFCKIEMAYLENTLSLALQL